MGSEFEHAHEHLEHAAHGETHESPPKGTAILIAVMAAALSLIEFAAKDAQTGYISNHIAASDTWAQYQAKSVRKAIYLSDTVTLASLPNASDPAVQKRLADARSNAARMQSESASDGMDQLAEKAHEQEHERDHEMHRAHLLEIASGGLQIAIVLSSIAILIGLPHFKVAGVVLAVAAAVCGLLGAMSLI
jgi:hypothetical protein